MSLNQEATASPYKYGRIEYIPLKTLHAIPEYFRIITKSMYVISGKKISNDNVVYKNIEFDKS